MSRRLPFLLFLLVLISAGSAFIYIAFEKPNLLPTQLKDIITATPFAQQLETAGQSILPEQLQLLREVITPPPLRGPLEARQVTLTANGVFTFTNLQRQQNGNLKPLIRNATLDQAAQNKANDMFARQYFEHESPTGEGPSDVVDNVRYEYIVVGENLALGNFASDEALVQAWMDSPGHRANILNTRFQEIGIATIKGTYEGRTTWIGVQTFATPANTCPAPSLTLKQQVETNEAKLDTLQQTLQQQETQFETLKQEIDRLVREAEQLYADGNANIQKGNETYAETGSEEQAQPYWDKGKAQQAAAQKKQAEAETKQTQARAIQNQYNQTVTEYNTLLSQSKELINQYNQAVQTFNSCVKKFE